MLCVNEGGARDRARERLCVGMSRATDSLTVVGDPEVLRRVAGDEVARRLAIRGGDRWTWTPCVSWLGKAHAGQTDKHGGD